MDKEKLYSIFINSKNFSELFNNLYLLSKEQRSSLLSFEYLARKLNYKSKGHVSSIIKGEKRLPLEKCVALKNIFKLSYLEYNILAHMCSYEHAKLPSEKKVISTQVRVAKDEYSRRHFSNLPLGIDSSEFSYIYCCLGLLGKKIVTVLDIEEMVNYPKDIIVKCFDFLEEKGVLNKVNKYQYQYLNEGQHLRVSNENLELSIATSSFFIESALKSIKKWYSDKDLALFESSMLSVKEEDYKLFLGRLRAFIDSELSSIESSDGDLIIIGNSQFFPFKKLAPFITNKKN